MDLAKHVWRVQGGQHDDGGEGGEVGEHNDSFGGGPGPS